jgi:hypothetical protein
MLNRSADAAQSYCPADAAFSVVYRWRRRGRWWRWWRWYADPAVAGGGADFPTRTIRGMSAESRTNPTFADRAIPTFSIGIAGRKIAISTKEAGEAH